MKKVLVVLFLAYGCASADSEFLKKNTAIETGCSEQNLKVDKESWKHEVMSGIATYTAYCKDKKFYCSQRSEFRYKCTEAND